MFLDKVGSDACLMLTATADLENGTITIDQQFTFEDLKKALNTRMVCIKTTSSIEGAVILYVGAYGATDFTAIGVDMGLNVSVFEFINSGDNIWVASLGD